MARIYRAEHQALRKQFALKVMESALLERPDGRPRFLREGQAAAAVKHPNVVDITDVGVWQGRPYLVMELLEGEDLEQYLSRNKPLAETDVARLMIPVIAGLATAHASGVIHRDLKPSNIFLARGPDALQRGAETETVPKLLDFGISKLTSLLENDPSSTPLGELMGSPMYMSPEAVRGARDLTPHSDQYSLGVILYECVTGRPPFYGDSLLSVLEAVAHAKFETPRRYRPDLSATMEAAILRAMSRDPRQRFGSVGELGRALCEAADHRTRLLWTPTFGLRETSLGRRTATLGPSPFRTGSALSASVPGAAKRRHGRTILLAALGAGLLSVFGAAVYRQLPTAPELEKSVSGARPSALDAPDRGVAEAVGEQASKRRGGGTEGAEVGRGGSGSGELAAAPDTSEMSKGGEVTTEKAARRAAGPLARPTPHRARGNNSRPVTPTVTRRADARDPEGPRSAVAPVVSDPADSDFIEAEVGVRPVAAPKVPALGANQSPILD
jgi:eukaryotic-like serine/threonine-protein kinase